MGEVRARSVAYTSRTGRWLDHRVKSEDVGEVVPGINPMTGQPDDYDALIRQYHAMVLKAAERCRIPEADREDAAQAVEIRFWEKSFLEKYDPEMLHAVPAAGWRDGAPPKPRKAKFSSFYRRFVGLYMLQEMDRHHNRINRVRPVEGDPMPEKLSGDHADEVIQQTDAQQWQAQARKAVAEEAPHLSPLIDYLLDRDEPKMPTRQELATLLAVTPLAAARYVVELRTLLDEVGLGPQSLMTA